MAGHLFPIANSIHLTALDNPRSASPADIAALRKRFQPRIRLHRNARKALRSAWNSCPPDGLVVVTGSLYLVGEVLPMIEKEES